MTPIKYIRTELAEKPKQPNLEDIGARLLHHGFRIMIDNQFLSDVGDNWCCEITGEGGESATMNQNGHHAPSLRTAIITALESLEECIDKQ